MIDLSTCGGDDVFNVSFSPHRLMLSGEIGSLDSALTVDLPSELRGGAHDSSGSPVFLSVEEDEGD